MKRITKLETPISFISSAAVGGYEEKRGPLGNKFDFCDPSDKFGQKTWEIAEGEMGRVALNTALTKAKLSHEDIGLLVAGDLQNQCVASSTGLHSFGIPFVGVYGACSTCTESLMTLSAFMSTSADLTLGAAVTTSHNAAAERQFRTPIEYGGQRAKTAQWTSTAAGAFILGRTHGAVEICEYMPGRIIDGATADGSNMGGAMAFAAADTIINYFNESGESASNIDYIVTGDLGKVGSDVLKEILIKELPGVERLHTDCGLLLYDFSEQDAHSGASGCGTSASVLASHFIPLLNEGKIKNILFMSTGALMSPSSLLQGENIFGTAPLIRLKSTIGEKE
ncbi:MAG: stage V sporulation protein AD [Ruminococcaceae bacterium]|nr:stage V sporulation protein AD [Oscillospiraceae bacterium]